jgi:hypothetical protein
MIQSACLNVLETLFLYRLTPHRRIHVKKYKLFKYVNALLLELKHEFSGGGFLMRQ